MSEEANQTASVIEAEIVSDDQSQTRREFQTAQRIVPRFGLVDEKTVLTVVPVSRRTWGNWKRRGLVPFIRLPGSRRCLYDLESVRGALLRMQRGGGQ